VKTWFQQFRERQQKRNAENTVRKFQEALHSSTTTIPEKIHAAGDAVRWLNAEVAVAIKLNDQARAEKACAQLILAAEEHKRLLQEVMRGNDALLSLVNILEEKE